MIYMKYSKVEIGELGECYVRLELAKRKINCMKVNFRFDYDFLLQDGKKLEVKTATLRQKGKKYTWKVWQFGNTSHAPRKINGKLKWVNEKRDRFCDFFIFLCLDDKFKPKRYYIIPKKEIGKRTVIDIGITGGKWQKWKDRWDLIS